MSERLREELMKRIEKLDDARAAELLAHADELAEPKTLVTYGDWRKLAGTIRPDVLDAMERAIEEGCERIDPEGW